MGKKLLYDYSSMTTHKGIPMITAREFIVGQKEYPRQSTKEKAKNVARNSLVKDK